MIKKFNQFLNEGLIDKLTGPTDKNVWEYVKNLTPQKMFDVSCKAGFLKGIELALENGAEINGDDGDAEDYDHEEGYEGNELSITNLIKDNHNDVLKKLLDKYSDEMQLEDFLEYAVMGNNLDAVKLLVEHGADINDENYSILSLGVTNNQYNSHYAVIEYLLEHGGKPDKFSINFAKKHDDIEIIELLNRFK